MHPYSTDSAERTRLVFYMAIFSMAIFWLLSWLLAMIKGLTSWGIAAPSIAIIFGGTYFLFNKYSWKWSLLHKVGLVNTPDLSGIWTGTLNSSNDNYKKDYQIKIIINQNWTKISVRLVAEKSTSHSIAASIVTYHDGPYGVSLTYLYQNDPRSTAEPSMQIHRGAVIFHLSSDNTLEGDYFSDKGRRTNGSINVIREIESETLDKKNSI